MVQPAARVVAALPRRPLARRRDQRFLHRVFRGGEVVAPTRDGAEHLRRQLAQQMPDAASAAGPSHLRWGAHHLPHLDGDDERRAARPGRGGRLRGDLVGALGACPPPRSRTRRGTPWPRGTARRSRRARRPSPRAPPGPAPAGQAPARRPTPPSGQLPVEPRMKSMWALRSSGAQSLTW